MIKASSNYSSTLFFYFPAKHSIDQNWGSYLAREEVEHADGHGRRGMRRSMLGEGHTVGEGHGWAWQRRGGVGGGLGVVRWFCVGGWWSQDDDDDGDDDDGYYYYYYLRAVENLTE